MVDAMAEVSYNVAVLKRLKMVEFPCQGGHMRRRFSVAVNHVGLNKSFSHKEAAGGRIQAQTHLSKGALPQELASPPKLISDHDLGWAIHRLQVRQLGPCCLLQQLLDLLQQGNSGSGATSGPQHIRNVLPTTVLDAQPRPQVDEQLCTAHVTPAAGQVQRGVELEVLLVQDLRRGQLRGLVGRRAQEKPQQPEGAKPAHDVDRRLVLLIDGRRVSPRFEKELHALLGVDAQPTGGVQGRVQVGVHGVDLHPRGLQKGLQDAGMAL
mmetsp:Transcript_77735/g.137046  ORF Transcript_77735/g.137046 Transcript_77735/m.137046 type:complete len:266 (-) Transcript_77735:401-1198(-)